MDYIRFRSLHHFNELVCLCNVAEGEGTAEIMDAPATTDILMEVPYQAQSPIPPMIVQYRIQIVPATNMLDVTEEDRLTPFDALIDFSTYCEYRGAPWHRLLFTAILTPTRDRMAVRLGVMPDYRDSDFFDEDRDIKQAGRVLMAFAELNWLIFHQPQVIKEHRAPAEASQLKVLGKKAHRVKVKGRSVTYLHMLTVPSEKSPDWETLKAKTPDAVQDRAIREITCPVWEVRGHMRHYKSGKTVYVAPYRKGKERDSASAVSGKEYVLTGGDHAGKN